MYRVLYRIHRVIRKYVALNDFDLGRFYAEADDLGWAIVDVKPIVN